MKMFTSRSKNDASNNSPLRGKGTNRIKPVCLVRRYTEYTARDRHINIVSRKNELIRPKNEIYTSLTSDD